MKNIPRIFINENLETGKVFTASKDVLHYLGKVMRRSDCLAFNNGREFYAVLNEKGQLVIHEQTEHDDVSSNITLLFAPIKKTDDLLNMATQMGVKTFQPVMTEHTVAKFINWERMKKIVIEASEQSNRNSVPEILPIIKFSELDFSGLAFADERFAYDNNRTNKSVKGFSKVLIGPEGGFSDSEFEALDKNGAVGFSLGKTILRAELAGPIALSRIINYED